MELHVAFLKEGSCRCTQSLCGAIHLTEWTGDWLPSPSGLQVHGIHAEAAPVIQWKAEKDEFHRHLRSLCTLGQAHLREVRCPQGGEEVPQSSGVGSHPFCLWISFKVQSGAICIRITGSPCKIQIPGPAPEFLDQRSRMRPGILTS